MKTENNRDTNIGILDNVLRLSNDTPALHISAGTCSGKTKLATYIARNLSTVSDDDGTVMFANTEEGISTLINMLMGGKSPVIIHKVDLNGLIQPASCIIDNGLIEPAGPMQHSLYGSLDKHRPKWLVIDAVLAESALNHIYNIAALIGTAVILIDNDTRARLEDAPDLVKLSRDDDILTIVGPYGNMELTLGDLSNI